MALERPTQVGIQLRQLTLASHRSRRAALRRQKRFFLESRHKPVAALRQSFDEPWSLRVVAQRLAQLQNVFAQDFGLDVGLGPNRFEQLLLGYQPSGVIDKVAQDRKHLGGQSDTGLAPPQTLVYGVQSERTKCFHLLALHTQRVL